MSVIRLLYIDDNKMEAQIDLLRKKLKRNGHELKETFLHLNETFMTKDPDTGETKLDKHKIHKFINDNYINDCFDVVASDYDFRDRNLDGFELLKWIKNESQSKKYRIRRAKFCLYSSEQDKVVKKFNTPEQVKMLVKLKIDDFIDRTRIPDEITNIVISKESTYDFKQHLIAYMEKFGTEKFLSTYPKYKDKTLADIVNEIDKDLPNGIDFQKFIAEQTIANIIELNNFPKQ